MCFFRENKKEKIRVGSVFSEKPIKFFLKRLNFETYAIRGSVFFSDSDKRGEDLCFFREDKKDKTYCVKTV